MCVYIYIYTALPVYQIFIFSRIHVFSALQNEQHMSVFILYKYSFYINMSALHPRVNKHIHGYINVPDTMYIKHVAKSVFPKR